MDPEERAEYISGTDVKNWVYCPLIVYYRKIMGAKPKIFEQQKAGMRKHVEMQNKIKRRIGIAARKNKLDIIHKEYNKIILNEKEKLIGLIDMVVVLKNREIVPIEIKSMKSNNGKAWRDHVYQITFYAILLEKQYRKIIKRGYIYYEDNKLIEVIISNHEKNMVRKIINSIREMMNTEKQPRVRIHAKKCTGGCGYRWICKK